MEKVYPHPLLAFIWRPEEISRPLIEMSEGLGVGAIIDITDSDGSDTEKDLISWQARDIRISAGQFMDPELENFLRNTSIKNIWIEYHPALYENFGQEDFFKKLASFSNKFHCLPVVSQPELLSRLIRMKRPPRSVCLKGSEASGYVSSEATGILFSTLRELLKENGKKIDLIIWGGISTPEAAAAFLCSGSAGIVFESLHWLTDRISIDDTRRGAISRLRPEHTTVVGLNLGLPVRVFDKGNSRAVNELKRISSPPGNDGGTQRERRIFAGLFSAKSVHPFKSGFGREDLISIGPEASCAEAFAERFGRSTEKAIGNFLKEISRLCEKSGEIKNRFIKSPLEEKLKTRYPIIQGAMSWISDVPEFALKVAEAGALPTFALGLRSAEELKSALEQMKKIMGGLPYALNIITLSENPYRDEQLALIEMIRPPFVVIAAGEPSFASRLLEKGMEVIYVTPDLGLLRMALESGVQYVVLEGHEAGGHVGELSTLTLSQAVLEFKRREPELFFGRHVIVAGGIFNGETAFRAAALGADGVQVGTAYLATEEIVATGALTPLYQRKILESAPGMTAVTGESVGLRVRSLKSPKTEAIMSLERKFLSGKEDELSFRSRLEEMSAGSLLKAARGVDKPGGEPLDEKTCVQEGQFMSGASAGAIRKVIRLSDLHGEIAGSSFEPVIPPGLHDEKKKPLKSTIEKGESSRIAITGMAVVNALANSPDELWQAVLAMQSGIIEAPLSKVNIPRYFDPKPLVRDKTYCKVAAFRNLDISRKDLDIAPQDFRTMSESTKLTLWLARHAIEESGILDSDIPSERIGVIVSQNAGESASTLTDLVINLNAHKILDSLGDFIRKTPEEKLEMVRQLKDGRLNYDDTTLMGRLNSGAGGFICNKYGFMGPSFSVTAACASSLVALYNAVMMIRNGVIDAAVIGGGEENVHAGHFLEFSALGSLAGLSGIERLPSEYSRPFDAGRDGLVLGEGGGILVIERESAAVRRGAFIHAFITGVGASNNEQGMVESSAKSQIIAMRNSFKDSGYSPEKVDLVECHATSTVQGDIEEVKALKTVFPRGKETVLTSLKSQIGHTLGTAGINSLIRGVKAMQEGVYPPTLNYLTPDPEIGLEDWGFRVATHPEEWPKADSLPRRLMVNAFGFGGANFVVQIEQSTDGTGNFLSSQRKKSPVNEKKETVREDLLQGLGISFFETGVDNRSMRVGVVADDENTARKIISELEPVSRREIMSHKYQRVLARRGVFISPADQRPVPMAFAFSGQGTYYSGMGKELYHTFREIRKWIDRMAGVAEFDLLDLLFNASEDTLKNTRWQQPALFTIEYAIARFLMSCGVRPHAVAGHSLGQNTALCIAQVFTPEDGFRLVNKRAECMDKASGLSEDPGSMLAVDVPLDVLRKKIHERKNIFFTNYNSPRQVVLGGGTEEILKLQEELKDQGYRATRLNVSMAFHSPVMNVVHDELEQFLSGITFNPPKIPVISNTNMKPFPDDPVQIRKLLMAHLESPVHWMQNVETLWNDFGIRLFVEVGPRDTLCNLIGEIVNLAQCLQTCEPGKEASVFRETAAKLFSTGHLKTAAPPRYVDFPALPGKEEVLNPGSFSGDSVGTIVQRELNAFLLESFGKFLKPRILEAVRREVDPSFRENDLDNVLKAGISRLPAGRPAEIAAHPTEEEYHRSPDPGTVPGAPSIKEGPVEGSETDYLEDVIGIIMDATGYERDEIEPDMDIRKDLAIRSSRLPVIMDAAERKFGISIRVEDFIGVKTVRQMAERIAQVSGTGENKKEGSLVPGKEPLAPPLKIQPGPSEDENQRYREPLRRFVFSNVPIDISSYTPPEIEAGNKVAVLVPGEKCGMKDEMVRFLIKELKTSPLVMDFLGQGKTADMHDIRSSEGREKLFNKLSESGDLAGIVILLDPETNPAIGEPEKIPELLTGFFRAFQGLLSSRSRKFCVSVMKRSGGNGSAEPLFNGLTGMFLAAAQEYGSIMFRTVSLDRDTRFKDAIRRSFSKDTGLVQISFKGGEAFTLEASSRPARIDSNPGLSMNPGDVVIISGGARGITNHLARVLWPFKPRLVLLGRSQPDPVIRQNLHQMEAAGMDVSYFQCDVTEGETVSEIIGNTAKKYGRIDGIIHGAGILKDSFAEMMSEADFKKVVDTKVLGAWNLYAAARSHGLRFMVSLSSVTAIHGNVGQINYCAANRALSALMSSLSGGKDGIYSKSLILPPIDGDGMASDPEMKDLLKLRGMESAYVHVNELAQFFCREVLLGPADDSWVMPARLLPELKTVRINREEPLKEELESAGFVTGPGYTPMIQGIKRLDLFKCELEAERIFSHTRDPWISDHKPFKELKHPLVSGIMAVESFMEAAKLLFPYLGVIGVRGIQYNDMLECPPDTDRETRIACTHIGNDSDKMICRVSMTSRDISPTGRSLESWSKNFEGRVILGPGPVYLHDPEAPALSSRVIEGPPLSKASIQDWYENGTSLKGRYRVIEEIEGAGSEYIKGTMIYKQGPDFAGVTEPVYQYSPYLLEALMHLVTLYTVTRKGDVIRGSIPAGIGEMRFSRTCTNGERLSLEAVLKSEDSSGHYWNALAADEQGEVIMRVEGLHMKWFS